MNRRTSARLAFGVSYTGSVSRNLGAIDPFIEDNVLRNYTLNGSRPHNLSINYSYRIPGDKWDNALSKAILDGWQISGITSVLSGARQGFTLALTGVSNVDGSVGGPASAWTSSAITTCRAAAHSERQFKTECIQRPGDPAALAMRKRRVRGPGHINHDFSLFKNVTFAGHRMPQFARGALQRLQLDAGLDRAPRRRSTPTGTRPTRHSASHRRPRLAAHPAGAAVHLLITRGSGVARPLHHHPRGILDRDADMNARTSTSFSRRWPQRWCPQWWRPGRRPRRRGRCARSRPTRSRRWPRRCLPARPATSPCASARRAMSRSAQRRSD